MVALPALAGDLVKQDLVKPNGGSGADLWRRLGRPSRMGPFRGELASGREFPQLPAVGSLPLRRSVPSWFPTLSRDFAEAYIKVLVNLDRPAERSPR